MVYIEPIGPHVVMLRVGEARLGNAQRANRAMCNDTRGQRSQV